MARVVEEGKGEYRQVREDRAEIHTKNNTFNDFVVVLVPILQTESAMTSFCIMYTPNFSQLTKVYYLRLQPLKFACRIITSHNAHCLTLTRWPDTEYNVVINEKKYEYMCLHITTHVLGHLVARHNTLYKQLLICSAD